MAFSGTGLFRVILAFYGALSFSAPIGAQDRTDWSPRGLQLDRVELEALLEEFETAAGSSGYSTLFRQGAQRDADLIRERLAFGDFRTGDRVRWQVEGELGLPEELAVEPGPRITLPEFGSISLEGVLRSELEEHLTRELSRYFRNPVVRAESEIRVAVLGAVGSPGFYTVPADMLLEEALMNAGGPGGDADLEDIRLERLGERLWSGDEMRTALAEGRTLDQLSLRGGDQIVVPSQSPSSIWRAVSWGAGVAATVWLGVRVARF